MSFEVGFLGLTLFDLSDAGPRVLLVNATGDYAIDFCHSSMDSFEHEPHLFFLEADAAVKGEWDGLGCRGGICDLPLHGLRLELQATPQDGVVAMGAIPSVSYFDPCYDRLKPDSELGPARDKAAIASLELPARFGHLRQGLLGMDRPRNVATTWQFHPNSDPSKYTSLAETVFWGGAGGLTIVDAADGDNCIIFEAGQDARLVVSNLPTRDNRRPIKSKERLGHHQLYYQLFQRSSDCEDEKCKIPHHSPVSEDEEPSWLRPIQWRQWLRRQGPMLTFSAPGTSPSQGGPEARLDGDAALCPPSKFP